MAISLIVPSRNCSTGLGACAGQGTLSCAEIVFLGCAQRQLEFPSNMCKSFYVIPWSTVWTP